MIISLQALFFLILAIFLIVCGLWMDIIGLIGILKWNRTAHSKSGIPLIPLIFYIAAGYLLSEFILGIHKGLLIVLLMGFHLIVYGIVPWLDRWLLKMVRKMRKS